MASNLPLKEYTSKHLNVPFIILKDKQAYLLANGVLFTKEEYMNGIDLQSEYVRRAKSDELYDYTYAKNTGFLRKKRGTVKKEDTAEKVQETKITVPDCSKKTDSISSSSDRRNISIPKSVMVICALLAITSVICMYVSTLHTATYLYDYVDIFSAWLMSASVTFYSSTAFEVVLLFHGMKRNFLASIFMLLWIMVTLFSMATTVSVFYDRYNFNESQIAEENKGNDSSRLALELLQKKEKDLREAISFKKKDIEYRQEREYATTAVRNELTKLESELQNILDKQQKILETVPEAVKEEYEVQKKESLFKFLGRVLHIEGGILEFVMSTLSAVFVNLIAPLSLSAVIELLYKKKEDKNA